MGSLFYEQKVEEVKASAQADCVIFTYKFMIFFSQYIIEMIKNIWTYL